MFVRLLLVLFHNLELAINFEQMKLNIATVIFNSKHWLESNEFIICLLFIHNVFFIRTSFTCYFVANLSRSATSLLPRITFTFHINL